MTNDPPMLMVVTVVEIVLVNIVLTIVTLVLVLYHHDGLMFFRDQEDSILNLISVLLHKNPHPIPSTTTSTTTLISIFLRNDSGDVFWG